MALLSKGCKPSNFESHNSLKLSLTNIQGLRSNFVECEYFLQSNSPDIFVLFEINLDDSINSSNFSVRGYLPLIRKDSITHMHGLPAYVKEGLPFARYLSLENSADSYLRFRLALLHSVSYFFFLYRSPSSYLVKPHSFLWFSGAFVAAKVHRNHFFCFYQQNKSYESKLKFKQAVNRCKRILEAIKLAYANKTKESITSQKLGSLDFWRIANIVFSAKLNLLYFLSSTARRCYILHLIKINLFAKNFSKNSNHDDLGISLPVFSFRTNLKLYNTSVTTKVVKKVITNLDSSKASGPDCNPVEVLKNYELEVSYILAQLFNMCLKESCSPDCWKVSSRVNNRIVDYLDKYDLFSDFQYGFSSSRSTVDLLTVGSDRIAKAFNRSVATRAVALDISKAFDRFWCAGLLHELESYGISGQLLGIISFFSQ